MSYPTPLVDTQWLADHLVDENVRILDGSWYLPQTGRDAMVEYSTGHIPAAVFCDLEKLSDRTTSLPHMLPPPSEFAAEVGRMGIGNETFVVGYDGSGLNLSAPRIWWMFRAFGHDRVAVLDGGLKKWRREGRPVETGVVSVVPKVFVPSRGLEAVRTLENMKENAVTGREQVLDARSRGRFAGTEPEPRPGLRGGHIPGSHNLPFQELIDDDGTMLRKDRLQARYEAAGIDLSKPVVTTCGSGTTACALLLGLHVLGAGSTALYDGSWSEWGAL